MVYISILLNLKVKKINSLQFFMLLRATRDFFFFDAVNKTSYSALFNEKSSHFLSFKGIAQNFTSCPHRGRD